MNITSIIRTILTLVGSYLIGHNLFGTSVNESLWQEISGGIMVLVGIVMSILDKTISIEKVQGALRHIVLVAGGLLIAKGVVTPAQIEMYIGLATALVPVVYGWLSKKKSQQVASGDIPVQHLKQ
jgi:Ca2+/Na+ antiporter